ncbi:PAS domain S-box protein (plasmid) [Halomicrobium sp. HM KBTZ05]|uniref:PAS domain S-box protein n=1 Tax=Halomicrobium sp. HM KBTZ05 TaxID=3242663 RepID=UPI003558074A
MSEHSSSDSRRTILAPFDLQPPGTPLTTTEILNEVDTDRSTTCERLHRLVERDALETKAVGAEERIWWRPTAETRESADRQFSSLVAAVEEYAIFRLDESGRVQSWNAGAERLKGYAADDIVGEHFSRFYTESDREAAVPERNLAAAVTEGWIEDEGWRVRQDGTRFWANVTITALRDDAGALTGFTKVTRDMTERREYERRLREETAFTESILDNQRDIVYAFDTEGRLLRWNETLEAVTGYDPAAVSEMGPIDFVVDGAAERVVGALARVFDGESVTTEAPLVTADGETIPYEFSGTPLTDERGTVVGVTGIGRDISERKATERQLERQRERLDEELSEVFDRVDDAFFALDEEWRFTHVNERAATVLDRSVGELLGATIWDEFPAAADSTFRDQYWRAVETQESVSFEEYFPPLATWFEVTAYPSETGLSVYFRDVTERKLFEERLTALNQASRDLLTAESEARVSGVLARTVTAVFDLPLCAVYASDEVTGQLVPVEESIEGAFEGVTFTAVPADDSSLAGRVFERGAARYDETLADLSSAQTESEGAGGQIGSLVSLGGHGLLVVGSPEPLDADTRQLLELLAANAAAAWDRVRHERDLQRRVRQQAIVTRLGQAALEDRNLDTLMADAATAVADGLDNDYCKVLELDDGGTELLLRQGVGWDDGIVGTATVSATESDSQAAYTLRTEEPVVVTDFDAETRFSGPALLANHDVRAGISVVVGPSDDPWGILGTHDRSPKQFSPHDASFVQSIATILATAIERHRDEQVLVDQREQLAALVGLNEVVGQISDSLIDQSSREEIETVVCERLTATESYEFAWIGSVDHRTQTVELEAEAGVENYLDDVSITVDAEDEHGCGPTGRAFRTGTVQTCQDIPNDPKYAPWRDRAREYGFRSSAAVPITHDGTTYGVLNVYAERSNAFSGQERAVLGQLGGVVGHAIAAIERKRALMCDDVVELGFQIPEPFSELGVDPVDGTIRLAGTVPVGDGSYVMYGSATEEASQRIGEIADRLPHWDGVEFRGGDDGERRFEIRLTEPPVLSTVASVGGTIVEAVLEDGHYHMTVQVPPGDGVRQVLDTVRGAYPDAEMVLRRQTTRDSGITKQAVLDLSEALTDRQLAALRAAYHAGFFEWPRDASGEEVAESLDVAAPTFHQHLRKAEQTVFDSILATLA